MSYSLVLFVACFVLFPQASQPSRNVGSTTSRYSGNEPGQRAGRGAEIEPSSNVNILKLDHFDAPFSDVISKEKPVVACRNVGCFLRLSRGST